ncbi:F-box/LRR-repeat protein At3g59190-like [Papaver somniferum]|uniref:F-box/LRR-repeat protein At3g59190-like n=1 Tax=Papaver somniferum TaxID=3469 RepID=UPI000E6FD891|nr:F-box/LRR-repeat protein At3g59190-like [Papaver somniferum]XP_026421641.1 F-box/LRR-repeat protein At3g59190-like [Papaver somniferum]XP_026421643.1 F-box/LRR-repeat protein At3g59190-like [Papaver somniferum]
MELKQLKGQNSMSEQAEDRITNLPESLLHYVLSLLDIKEVARTSVLSKRWYCIWISVPTLDFRSLSDPFPSTPSRELSDRESIKFMDMVDRILHLHDMSSIQKLSLRWNYPLNESRVYLWISAAIRRNVEKLSLTLIQNASFSAPLSLCNCESLVTLKLDIYPFLYLPKYMSFPKLKHLKLSRVMFSDEYINGKLFSSCPVLENLTLETCEWLYIKKFCLSTPSLKVLEIWNLDYFGRNYGLGNCSFEIHAPLVSLTYWGDVPKEFVMSNFLTLAEVDVRFGFEDKWTGKKIDQGANLSKFLRALSHVKCVTISDRAIQVLSFTHDLKNNLPTFHNLTKLNVTLSATDYKALIALLESAPNLESVAFTALAPGEDHNASDDDGWGLHLISTRCLFLHLKSARFEEFSGHPSEFRWVELILKQAAALETITFLFPDSETDEKELMEKLTSLPRASASCVFNFP